MTIAQQQIKEMVDHYSNFEDINLEDIALPNKEITTTDLTDIMPKNISILWNGFSEVCQF